MIFAPLLISLAATMISLIDSPSPITADTVALSGVSYSSLVSYSNDVYAACRDPKKAGKTSLVRLGSGEVVGADFNVRSAVHEYGGGPYCVYSDGIIFTDFPSHILYVKKGKAAVDVLLERKSCRFADFMVHHDHLYAVMEDHTNPEPSKVQNSIVSISLETAQLTVVASGHDFYACPQVSLDGTKLAYVAWDHPNMPWDTTMLYTQTLEDGKSTSDAPVRVQMDECSMAEPRWQSPSSLYFLSDLTGWYNIYRLSPDGTTVNVLPTEADFVGGAQGWMLGQSPYVIQNGNIITATKKDGMIKIDNDGVMTQLKAPSTAISSLCTTADGKIYYIGGSTIEPPGIWCYADNTHTKIQSSIDDAIVAQLQPHFSKPKQITFPSASGRSAHAYFYPPRLDNDTVKPPLLVQAHGGPTSQTSTTFRLDIQYWTTRGFGVLDVDYGGSTGYGRDYRRLLQGTWGIVDVEDTCRGALYCVEMGWANGDWLAIDGRSAGGYTTLAALTFGDVFKAGASLYGISSLVTLCSDTHKFESRYLDGLVGPYPEAKETYDKRCPINFTEKLNCPVILLQGDEDKVVPPNQAESMFDALKGKGLDTTFVLYKGEQHGFRKGENIRHALNSEYSFFCQVFGVEALGVDPVDIGVKVEI